MLACHGPILSRHLYPWSPKNLYLFLTKWPSLLSRNFKQKPTHVSADRMVFTALWGKYHMYPSLYVLGFFFLNSEACYISPALSSFEVHREIIFIELQKIYCTWLHRSHTLANIDPVCIRPPHWGLHTSVYLSYVFWWTNDFQMQNFKNSHFCTPFLSSIHNRSHNIKFTSALVSSPQVFYVLVTHIFVSLLFSHTMNACVRFEKLTLMSNIPIFKDQKSNISLLYRFL